MAGGLLGEEGLGVAVAWSAMGDLYAAGVLILWRGLAEKWLRLGWWKSRDLGPLLIH